MAQHLWIDFEFPDGAKARGVARLPTNIKDLLKELSTNARRSGGLHAAAGTLARLEAEKKHLGFDPRMRSHELTACKNDLAKRSPKRVLRALSGDDRDRERRCWREAPLSILHERGAENGLAAYLTEVATRLAGLIGHPS
jgi:hypothetical protein